MKKLGIVNVQMRVSGVIISRVTRDPKNLKMCRRNYLRNLAKTRQVLIERKCYEVNLGLSPKNTLNLKQDMQDKLLSCKTANTEDQPNFIQVSSVVFLQKANANSA